MSPALPSILLFQGSSPASEIFCILTFFDSLPAPFLLSLKPQNCLAFSRIVFSLHLPYPSTRTVASASYHDKASPATTLQPAMFGQPFQIQRLRQFSICVFDKFATINNVRTGCGNCSRCRLEGLSCVGGSYTGGDLCKKGCFRKQAAYSGSCWFSFEDRR